MKGRDVFKGSYYLLYERFLFKAGYQRMAVTVQEKQLLLKYVSSMCSLQSANLANEASQF